MGELRGDWSWELGVRSTGFLFDGDFDEVGAGADAYIHAAGDDEFGLGLRVGGENLEHGDEVSIGKFGGLAAEQAADVTFGNAALFGEVALVELASFDAALQGDGEVAHREVDGGGLRVERRKREWGKGD